MLCSKCNKREATVYYKQNINGEIREYALCPECAAELNAGGFKGLSGLNLFGSLFSQGLGINSGAPKKRCTLCNCTFDDIRESGKVGCAKCYEVFADELDPMIRNIHGSAKHVGRAPKEFGKKRDEEKLINSLRQQLKSAIEKEEYEKAAQLRDKIKEIGGEEK